MARDTKLREVLDTLSGDPARSLPAQDRELMESVLRRLKIQENRRIAEPEPVPEPPEEDLTEQELQALREQQQIDANEMQRLQEERERLLDHQRELEDRLARLEAASHGGPLSYVDEPETVEFSRVDLPNQEEELLEFQYLGEGEPQTETPQPDAWDEEPVGEGETDWGDWPEANESRQESGVKWDEDNASDASPAQSEEPAAPAPSWEEPGEPGWEDEEREAQQAVATSWEEPGEEASAWPEPTGETETPPWSESGQEEAWPENEPEAEPEAAPAPTASSRQPPADEGLEDLDDRTRAELEELESQLAQLEREIEKRGGSEPAETEDDR